MPNEQFYMVWNPKRDMPRVKHATHTEAKAEAERLAKKQPGETFHILRSRTAVTVEKKPDLPAAHRLMLGASAAREAAHKDYIAAQTAFSAAAARLENADRALRDATVAFVAAGRA